MNAFDTMPDIPPCPHCGHAGDGLQWAFPDNTYLQGVGFLFVGCACLACGKHGAPGTSYAKAIDRFAAGKVEEAA